MYCERTQAKHALDVPEGKCLQFTGEIVTEIGLHAVQRARASGKGVGLDAEPLENANEQVTQRLIFLLGRAAPTGIADDPGTGQTAVLQQVDVLEVAAVVEAEV